MSGTKEQCSTELLTKLLSQRWPTYEVIGQTATRPITKLIKRSDDGSDFILIKSFSKNQDLYDYLIQGAMIPHWIPEDGIPTQHTLFEVPILSYKKTLLKEYIDDLLSVQSKAPLFKDNFQDIINRCRETYKTLK